MRPRPAAACVAALIAIWPSGRACGVGERPHLRIQRLTELRQLGHHARLRVPPTLAADEVVPEMHLQVMQVSIPMCHGDRVG